MCVGAVNLRSSRWGLYRHTYCALWLLDALRSDTNTRDTFYLDRASVV